MLKKLGNQICDRSGVHRLLQKSNAAAIVIAPNRAKNRSWEVGILQDVNQQHDLKIGIKDKISVVF
jgi:predicted RNA binding protein YcfA (HicA-like mRNA interferase family)